ncbi:SGNH/GDSL hydrolase family protein [Maioricimonas sp. JC845]|uniref:SGNH/GDSL hydrolase family protein n=1 Tax=Maioricimonas sp. JC845 TaxID=3232138 RepID=UPI0034591106
MRTILLLPVLFACSLFALTSASAQEEAAKFRAPLPKLELVDGDSIVFLGDSITHQCLYTQYVEDYFYTRFPHMRLKLHNAGVGGARAWDALARFDDDVAAYKPKYVTILLGMNDGSYRPYDETVFQTYRQDMTELIGRLQSIDATPIPMTPTMFDSRAARMGNRKRDSEAVLLYNSVLAYYGTWLREVAQQEGFGFVDMWSPLNNITLQQRKTNPDFTMIRDAVHPGPVGQVVMATAIVSDLGLQRQLSNIRISAGDGDEPTVRASGGEVSDLEFTEDGVSFTWAAKGLPWVVPEDAREGAKLTRLGHRLSREALEVHGLPAGRYTLTIDDVEVGTWSADALARHIELQENAKTPQYQQAAAVASLNKQRNEGPVRSLRGEWSQFQRYARTQRSAKENPDNDQLARQLAALEERISGMDERVAKFNEQAKEFEDQIFEVNQPQPRRYVLRRVEK